MLNAVGIVLQVIGAGWVVHASYKTRMSLARFNTKTTYDEIGSLLDKLRSELADSYGSQGIGFMFLLAGALCQLAAELM